MEMFTYLIYSATILGLLSLFYYLLLSKETFFRVNRSLLIGNLILALSIPLMPAPEFASQLKQDAITYIQKDKAPQSDITLNKGIHVNSSPSTISNKSSNESAILTIGINSIDPSITTVTILKWI